MTQCCMGQDCPSVLLYMMHSNNNNNNNNIYFGYLHQLHGYVCTYSYVCYVLLVHVMNTTTIAVMSTIITPLYSVDGQ